MSEVNILLDNLSIRTMPLTQFSEYVKARTDEKEISKYLLSHFGEDSEYELILKSYEVIGTEIYFFIDWRLKQ